MTLKLGKKIPATNLDMEAGKEYWLRIEVVNSFPTGYLVLTQVSAEQAQAESKKLEELKLGDLSGQHRCTGPSISMIGIFYFWRCLRTIAEVPCV